MCVAYGNTRLQRIENEEIPPNPDKSPCFPEVFNDFTPFDRFCKPS